MLTPGPVSTHLITAFINDTIAAPCLGGMQPVSNQDLAFVAYMTNTTCQVNGGPINIASLGSQGACVPCVA